MGQDHVSAKRSSSAAPRVKAEPHQHIPGDFAGWISEKHGIAWVVSKHRKDKRTGVVPAVKPNENIYVLQYEHREPGEHDARARFHGIAAANHQDAARQALAYMDRIKLEKQRRADAQLFYNEMEVSLWIGQSAKGARGK